MVHAVIDERDFDSSFIDNIIHNVDAAIGQAMQAVGGDVAKNIRTGFAMQGKRGGNKRWRRNSFKLMELNEDYPYGEGYREEKAYAKSKKALISTGKLRESIEVLDTGYKDGNWVLSIGTELDYAKALEYGAKGVKAVSPHSGNTFIFDIPARSFMYLTKQDGNLFAKAVKDAISYIS